MISRWIVRLVAVFMALSSLLACREEGGSETSQSTRLGTCPANTVRACDSTGCKCVQTGSAPADEWSHLAFDIAASGFTGAVKVSIARLITKKGVTAAVSKSFVSAVALDSYYVGENVAGNALGWLVKYLTPAERAAYKIIVRNGKFYKPDGTLFSTLAGQTSHSGAGRAIFVVDEAGDIYASLVQVPGQFHHSSLVAGGKVLTAGELVVENGVLKLISNKSGHYRPPANTIETLLGVLEQAGVKAANVTKDLI